MGFILTIVACSLAANGQDNPLKLRVSPPVNDAYTLPLTDALASIGSRVEGGYGLFGVEVRLKEGKEPEVTLPRESGSNLGTALREVLAQIPDCDMQVIAPRLIEVLPRGAKDDPNDPLNIQVAGFSVTNKLATAILDGPDRLIPELQAALSAGQPRPTNGIEVYSRPYTPPAMRITLHLQGVTVRQSLDAVVLATEQILADDQPYGWVYLVNSDDTPGLPKHTFKLHVSVPGNWRKYRSSGGPTK
jgi:hypothetical protein